MDFLPAQLMTKDGMKATSEILANKKAIAFYFSAHWCPPCRRFTPDLVEFYKTLKAASPDDLEIIFVSSDQDDDAFNEYYGEMPWVSIEYGDDAQDSLSQKFGVRGIPSFQIITPAGDVVDADGRSTVAEFKENPAGAMAKWAK